MRSSRLRVFPAIGSAAVRFRWPVVMAWLAAAVLAPLLLPSLGSVVRNSTASFLPAGSPSTRAALLDAPFVFSGEAGAILVAVRDDGRLDAGDERAISTLVAEVRTVHHVAAVRPLSISADGEAETVQVIFDLSPYNGGPRASAAVGAIRRDSASIERPGLTFHLTGELPTLVDQQHAYTKTQTLTQVFSALLIVLVLGVAFRAALAPLVALAPAIISLTVAAPLIAESTKAGVQVSSLLEALLVVLVLGAGTDYGLFLLFRFREALQAGSGAGDAVVAAVGRVGESITFSAATVVAALLSLLLASFGLYRGLGPGLVIGVLVVLAADLTLLPAALAILGPRVFWPSRPRPAGTADELWGRVAQRAVSRPVATLTAGLCLFGCLAVALVAYAPSGFNAGGTIPGSDSALGQKVLVAHFSGVEVNPTVMVFRFPRSVWENVEELASLQNLLESTGSFRQVVGALDPSAHSIPPRALAYAHRVLGPAQSVPVIEPPGTRMRPFLYDAYKATDDFISADGRTVQVLTSLVAGGPSSTAALQSIPRLRQQISVIARQVGASAAGVAGQAAIAYDVATISGRDVLRIIPVVLIVLAVLLALVLRSLVAPLYLVASVIVSFAGSLGLAVLIFVIVGGQLGVNFTLPFFMFVFIMALGEDYNILVMSRIREEAHLRPLDPAIARAVGRTGATVTSAGLVLAGTFGVLAVTNAGQVRQIGTGLALGILLDTFVVRTLLVPSAVKLAGRWSWWPSELWHPDRGTPGATPGSQDRDGGTKSGTDGQVPDLIGTNISLGRS